MEKLLHSTYFRKRVSEKKSTLMLLFVLCVFVIMCLFYINTMPFYGNAFPDERTHYEANVKFIIDNHRLPVAGKDDIQYFKQLRDNTFGQVNSVYSYNIYPQLNYVISAIVAKTLNVLLGIPLEIASRYASLLWGIIFVIFLYKLLGLFNISYLTRGIITASIVWIPGIVHIASYTSQDIHSLAISSILFYTFLKLIKKYDRKSLLGFACSFGLLFSAKLNYIVYVPFIIIILLIKYLRHEYSHKQFWNGVFWVSLFTLLISGGWYIRNFFLYHDFTGQKFLLQTMAEYGPMGIAQNISINSVLFALNHDACNTLFNTFFAWFAEIGTLPYYMYFPLKILILLLLILMVYTCISKRDKNLFYSVCLTGILILFSVILVFVNACKYDYQMQGRYLYPIVVPSACLLAYFVSNYKRHEIWIIGFLTMVALLSFETIQTAIVRYVPYQINTVEVNNVEVGKSQYIQDSTLGNIIYFDIWQTIPINQNSLEAIVVKVGTFGKDYQIGNINFSIIDSEGNVLGERKESISMLVDNSEVIIKLDSILENSKGQSCVLHIWCENTNEDTQITLYASAYQTLNNGSLYIDDNEQPRQLYYKTLYAKN